MKKTGKFSQAKQFPPEMCIVLHDFHGTRLRKDADQQRTKSTTFFSCMY
jgi:hypothetical protein